MTKQYIETRTSAVVMHITSLHTKYGIGDFGKSAQKYVNWLAECKIGIWQTLPLVPTGYGNSPYFSWSAFALNPLLIDLEHLQENNLLKSEDLKNIPLFPRKYVDFGLVINYKIPLLEKAAKNFLQMPAHSWFQEYEQFLVDESYWLNDAILFKCIHENLGNIPWHQWPDDLKYRNNEALITFSLQNIDIINEKKVLQFFAHLQWKNLKKYANEKGIIFMGDVPIYIAGDAADTWANQSDFLLDELGNPIYVAGVPPDAFTDLGQLWGNPIYNWDKMEKDNFSWWVKRIKKAFSLTELVRIDHFRAFASYYQIEANAENAINGKWVHGYGEQLFKILDKELNKPALIAEDLGYITEDVDILRNKYSIPGMLVLQFAFGDKEGARYLPHNHIKKALVYTGTHDSDTVVGWWDRIDNNTRLHFYKYTGSVNLSVQSACDVMMNMALSSVCNLAVYTMQDVLCLGNEARMNEPGVLSDKNWSWRMECDIIGDYITNKLKTSLIMYERNNIFKS